MPLTSWLGGRHRAPVECRAIPGHSPHLIAGADGDGGERLVSANMQPGGALGWGKEIAEGPAGPPGSSPRSMSLPGGKGVQGPACSDVALTTV